MPYELDIYCADIGSVPNRRFGWARSAPDETAIERHRGGVEIVDLVEAVVADIAAGCPVALGFECPLFVPVPEQALRLGTARPGEGNRSWSAGAGAGAMATGIVEVAWILSELRHRCSGATPYLDWNEFTDAAGGVGAGLMPERVGEEDVRGGVRAPRGQSAGIELADRPGGLRPRGGAALRRNAHAQRQAARAAEGFRQAAAVAARRSAALERLER